MSQTSRTSTNEHLEFIRKTMDRLHERGLVPGTQTVDAVIDHAAAMAQQLADVQEVCRNLSEAEREYGAELDARDMHVRRLQHALIREVNRNRALNGYIHLDREGIERYCKLPPGDLPDLPNDGSNGR